MLRNNLNWNFIIITIVISQTSTRTVVRNLVRNIQHREGRNHIRKRTAEETAMREKSWRDEIILGNASVCVSLH